MFQIKKTNYEKTIILVSCSLIASIAISQDYRADVKTPKGSNVAAWITQESSIQTRTYWDAYVTNNYPNAQQIKTYDNFSSSRRFNCHGYAWHMSELTNPLSEPRWIGYYAGNTDEHVYWQDGSHIEVSQEIYPGKVSWASGDHSAVTTNEKGWFISKWNEYPLLKHKWDDFPYGTRNLKYYKMAVVSPSISGPSTICDQATYTINNLPEEAAVQWSASNNCLTLIAGQGTPSALFRGNENDYCNVNATITIGGQSLPLQPLRIWCGTPVINNISGTQHFPMGGTGVYMAEVWGSDDTTLEWSVYPSLPVWFSGNHAYVTFPSTNGDYRITLTATNSCGSVESYHFASTGEYEPFRINPNPARNFVTVELQDDRTTNAYSASTAYEIQLWNATSLLRKFTTDQDTYQFSVSDLPRGIYFVRVIRDGKTHTQKLIRN